MPDRVVPKRDLTAAINEIVRRQEEFDRPLAAWHEREERLRQALLGPIERLQNWVDQQRRQFDALRDAMLAPLRAQEAMLAPFRALEAMLAREHAIVDLSATIRESDAVTATATSIVLNPEPVESDWPDVEQSRVDFIYDALRDAERPPKLARLLDVAGYALSRRTRERVFTNVRDELVADSLRARQESPRSARAVVTALVYVRAAQAVGCCVVRDQWRLIAAMVAIWKWFSR